jgi:5'-3' exonuclease
MFSGTARKKCFVPIYQIHVTEDIRESLLTFHALTGCDTTSQFAGIGKKSAWTVFVKFHDLLEHLGEESIANDQVLSNAETFVCHLGISMTAF